MYPLLKLGELFYNGCQSLVTVTCRYLGMQAGLPPCVAGTAVWLCPPPPLTLRTQGQGKKGFIVRHVFLKTW